MKKIKHLLLAAVAALGLASCNEGTNEYHLTTFLPINSGGLVTYADQSLDSIHVQSYDTWTLSNTTDWVDVKVKTTTEQTNQIKVDIPQGYFAITRLDFHLQPNTTGRQRSTSIQVTSSYAKIGTIGMQLIQQPFLNVNTPAAKKDEQNNITFDLSLQSAKQTETTSSFVVFTVYDASATLTSSADWLTPETTQGFTPSVTQKVKISAQPNTTGAARKATLTLTSKGISTVINVTQPKATN